MGNKSKRSSNLFLIFALANIISFSNKQSIVFFTSKWGLSTYFLGLIYFIYQYWKGFQKDKIDIYIFIIISFFLMYYFTINSTGSVIIYVSVLLTFYLTPHIEIEDEQIKIFLFFGLLVSFYIFSLSANGYYIYFKNNWKTQELMNPNTFSLFVFFVLLNILNLRQYFRVDGRKQMKFIYYFFVIIIIATLWLLKSRSTILALIIYLLFVVQHLLFKNIKLTRALTYTLVVSISLFPIIWVLAYNSDNDILLNTTLASTKYSKNIFSGRERLWSVFFGILKENPARLFLGLGSKHPCVSDLNGLSLHNTYLQIINNFGVVGLIPFMYFIKKQFKSKYKKLYLDSIDPFEAFVFIPVLVVMTFEIVFVSFAYLVVPTFLFLNFNERKQY